MKGKILLLAGISIFALELRVYAADIDLTKLTGGELLYLDELINEARKTYHSPSGSVEDDVLDAVKKEVEQYASELGVEDVSWAWFDYTYTREWDFYTLETHADLDDDSCDIYAETFLSDGEMSVYYLLVDKEVPINRREELPDALWSETPKPIIDEKTGIDLSTMSLAELDELSNSLDTEYKENHKPKNTSAISSVVKSTVDSYYEEKGYRTDWPWFDYTYTREWSLSTMVTSVDYKNDSESETVDVYAEVYNEQDVVYLELGEQVIIDERSSLPTELYEATEKESNIAEEVEVNEPATVEVNETETEIVTKIETETVTETEMGTEAVTETEQIAYEILYEEGAKGDEIKVLQEKLIEQGYLSGSADGDFGEITKAAVEEFQAANGLQVTGIITTQERDMLLSGLTKEIALRAAMVAIANYRADDVYTEDGSNYDPTKFHTYEEAIRSYVTLDNEGIWTQKDNSTWSVEELLLGLVGYDTFVRADLSVTYNGSNYIVSNADIAVATYENLDSPNAYIESLEPSDNNPFLTVTPELLNDDDTSIYGNVDVATENASDDTETSFVDTETYQNWVDSQFSWWDGHHKVLEELIKENMNDERSYDHDNTTYIPVASQEIADIYNSTLSEVDSSVRVEIGDLVVTTEFTGKNIFNATIKNQVTAVVSYATDTVTIIEWN